MGKCQYHPCHDLENMDCRLCYCPFYDYCQKLPTHERRSRGVAGYWLDRSSLGLEPVWACELCEIPHVRDVAEYYEKNKSSYSMEDLFNDCTDIYSEAMYRIRNVVFRIVIKTKGGWMFLRPRHISHGAATAHLKEISAIHPEAYIEEVPYG